MAGEHDNAVNLFSRSGGGRAQEEGRLKTHIDATRLTRDNGDSDVRRGRNCEGAEEACQGLL